MFIVCRVNDAGTLVASGALSIASRPLIPDAVVTKYVPPTVFN